MRILGLDIGKRRVGVATSDPTHTLARPLATLQVSDADRLDKVVAEVLRLADEEDGVVSVVVGLPRHLDGTPSDQTAEVEKFIAALRTTFERQAMIGEVPVLLTSPGIRPYVRSIVERFRPMTVVMSQNEVYAKARIKTVGQI